MKRIRQPKNNSKRTILLAAILLCLTGFAVYYFGIFKRTHLTSIEISHQLPMGFAKSRQFTAIGKYSDNSSRDITNMVAWRSSDTEIAAISNVDGTRGLVHSRNAGQTTITATDQSTRVVGTTLLNVLDAQLDSISVSPPETTITLGQKQQLTAMGTFSDGKKKEVTQSIIWGSSASSVAFLEDPVGSPGTVTSAATGSTIITAKDPKTGVIGTTSLTVSEARLISFDLSPNNPTIALGTDLPISATGTFSDGSTHEITTGLLWASSNQSVIQINDSAASKGMIHTKSVGSAVITATDPETGLTGSSTISVKKASIVSLSILQKNPVIPLGKTKQFMVRCKYSDGSSHVLKSSVSWSSSNPAVAQFKANGNQAGVAQSKTTGTTNITATAPQTGISTTTTLTIAPPKLVSYVISPRFPSLSLGKIQQLSVNGIFTDQSKKNLTNTSKWSIADPKIAKISNVLDKKGVITSLATGSTTISVKDTQTNISVTTTLIVTAAELVSMSISPAHAIIPLGQKKQLSVTGTLSDGSNIDLTQNVNWMSSNLSVAMVGNTPGQKGNVFSKTTGVSVITIKDPATGIKGTSKISVTSKELVSVNIETENHQIPLGTTLELMAKGLYSDGSIEDITESGNWISETPSVISIKNNSGSKGWITGASIGKSTIRFTDTPSKTSKTLLLTVTPSTLKAILIDPKASAIYLGDLQQFKAIGEYTDGTQKDITELVEWQSSNSILASIRNNTGRKGLATALAVGSSTIIATDRTTQVSGKASITGQVSW
jgi:hypothetical protein